MSTSLTWQSLSMQMYPSTHTQRPKTLLTALPQDSSDQMCICTTSLKHTDHTNLSSTLSSTPPQLATSHILRQRVIDQTLALVHHIYTESGLESIYTTYIDPTKHDHIQERRVSIRQIAQNPQQFGQHLQIASSDELRIALQKIIGSIDAIDIVEISAREFNALPIEEQQKIAAAEIFD